MSKHVKAENAIFLQRSNLSRKVEEISLINRIVVRDEYLIQLSILVRDINLGQKINDDACILETFILLNKLRNATFDMLDCYEIWQQSFTKIIPFEIFGSKDYLNDMATRQEFLNSVQVKNIYNFNIGTGNILTLPTISSTLSNNSSIIDIHATSKINKEDDKNGIRKKGNKNTKTPELFEQMQLFSSPPEIRTLKFYALMSRYLSPKTFKIILPLYQWSKNRWIPPLLSPPPIQGQQSLSPSLSTPSLPLIQPLNTMHTSSLSVTSEFESQASSHNLSHTGLKDPTTLTANKSSKFLVQIKTVSSSSSSITKPIVDIDSKDIQITNVDNSSASIISPSIITSSNKSMSLRSSMNNKDKTDSL